MLPFEYEECDVMELDDHIVTVFEGIQFKEDFGIIKKREQFDSLTINLIDGVLTIYNENGSEYKKVLFNLKPIE